MDISFRKILAVFLLFTVNGCIAVQDDGGYWQKGWVDKNLIGEWVNKEEDIAYRIFLKDSSLFLAPNNVEDPAEIKTVHSSNISVVLMESEDDEGSRIMVPYKIIDNKLSIYEPKNDKGREKATNHMMLTKFKNIEYCSPYHSSYTIEEMQERFKEKGTCEIIRGAAEYVPSVQIPILTEKIISFIEESHKDRDIWEVRHYDRVVK